MILDVMSPNCFRTLKSDSGSLFFQNKSDKYPIILKTCYRAIYEAKKPSGKIQYNSLW